MEDQQSLVKEVMAGLPAIPVMQVDLLGKGLAKSCLPPARVIQSQIEQFRNTHGAETSPFAFICYLEPAGQGKIALKFVLDTQNRQKDKVLTVTPINDDEAIKIMLGNTRKNRYMTSIRWELYRDNELNEIMDMGRFDQFDLLKDIDPDKWQWLQNQKVKPKFILDGGKLIKNPPSTVVDITQKFLKVLRQGAGIL